MDPQISALLSQTPDNHLPDASSPNSGRITLGSDENVATGTTYKLKGRVSLMDSVQATGTQYKLRGTLRF